MQSRFGHDFDDVRVHSDNRAAESARGINADAYAAGSHIVFGDGKYANGSPAYLRLLVHELTHVVQQRHAAQELTPGLTPPGDATEVEADHVAHTFMKRSINGITTRPDLRVSRQPAAAVNQSANLPIDAVVSAVQAHELGANIARQDYSDVFRLLNSYWLVVMLQALVEVRKIGLLQVVIDHIGDARGLDVPRLKAALTAVQMQGLYGENTPGDKLSPLMESVKTLDPQQQRELFTFLFPTAAKTGKFVVVSEAPQPGAVGAAPFVPSSIDFSKAPPAQSAPVQPATPLERLRKQLAEHPEAVLFWDRRFIEGVKRSKEGAAMSAALDQIKASFSSPGSAIDFIAGMEVGLPIGAVKEIGDMFTAFAEAVVMAYLLKLKIESDPVQVWNELKAFAKRLPDLLLKALNAEAIGEAVGQEIAKWLDERFLKRSAFEQGEVIGEILGRILLEIALLFVGPEEIAEAVSATARAAKTGLLGREVVESIETVPKLKSILEAKGAAGKVVAVETDAAVIKGIEAEPKIAGAATKDADVIDLAARRQERIDAQARAKKVAPQRQMVAGTKHQPTVAVYTDEEIAASHAEHTAHADGNPFRPGEVPPENIRKTRTVRTTETDLMQGDSGLLGERLKANGRPKPGPGYEAHHIVPAGEPRAARLRNFLESRGFRDINHADNGTWLPRGSQTENLGAEFKHEFTFDIEHLEGEYFERLEEILMRDPKITPSRIRLKLRNIRTFLENGRLPPANL